MRTVPFVDVLSMHRELGDGRQEMNSTSSYSTILTPFFLASFLSPVFLLGFLEGLFSLGLLCVTPSFFVPRPFLSLVSLNFISSNEFVISPNLCTSSLWAFFMEGIASMDCFGFKKKL